MTCESCQQLAPLSLKLNPIFRAKNVSLGELIAPGEWLARIDILRADVAPAVARMPARPGKLRY
jgi:hypothetical protein